MILQKKKYAIAVLLAFALVVCTALFALPVHTAKAVGGPIVTVSGAGNAALNGVYADGSSEWNGKCYYFNQEVGGNGTLGFWDGRWELRVNGNTMYAYSTSINPSNDKLPPSGGWSGNVHVSYGPSVSFSQTAVAEEESVGTVTLHVNMTSFPMGAYIYYSTSSVGCTATADVDYNAVNNGSVFVNGNETGLDITIGILDDTDYEADETFTVTLSNSAGVTVNSETCTVTIRNDDPQTAIGIGTPEINAGEESGSVTVPVTLSKKSSSPTTVSYATALGTATPGSDYTEATGTLTIPAGETSGNITLMLLHDEVYEGSESFTLALSSPVNGELGTQKTATITIDDDEAQPTVAFSADPADQAERNGDFNLEVMLSGICQNSVTVDYATIDGTAAAGSDYTAKSGTLTISGGLTTGVITIALKDDSYYEGSEDFQIVLSNPAVAALGTNTATVTVTDSESMPAISFDDTEITVSEDVGTVTLSVSLSGQAQGSTTVHYATGNGSAQAGSDYTAASGTIEIPGKTSSVTFSIDILNDSIYEAANESFTITLSDPSGATISTDTATVTITDNEDTPSIGFSVAAFSAAENAGTGTLQVVLSGAVQGPVTVNYATSDLTAKAGTDYTAALGTVTMLEGETTAEISIPLLGNAVYESDKTLSVTLSDSTIASLGTASAVFTIENDDAPPVFSFEDSSLSVSEGGENAVLTVRLTGATAFAATVDYATVNGTAKAGSEYTAVSGTVTLPAGSSEAEITIPILQNNVYGSEKEFTVNLSNPVHATLGDTAAAVTITDDEERPTIDFSDSTVTVTEQNGTVTLPVRLTAPCQEDVTVEYETADGTATAGGDYTAKVGTLTIDAGETTGSIAINVKDDNWYDGSEAFTVSLFAPTVAGLGAGTATVTIDDNEAMPQASFEKDAYPVGEGDDHAVLRVNLTGKAQRDTQIQYATADGTAKAGADYTNASGTLTILGDSLSGTLEVPVLEDGLYEEGESFFVSLTALSGATVSEESAAVNIDDNETQPQIGFSPDTYTVSENAANAVLSLNITVPAQADMVLHYVTQAGTATAPGDFTQTSGTKTIPGGSTTASISIPLADDDLYEGNENFLVVLQQSTIATLGTDTASVVLTDTEAMPSISFSAAAFEKKENGGSGMLTVSLSGKSQSAVTVAYATAAGTAQPGADFTATQGILTIPGGQTQGSVPVPLLDDSIYEGDESFTVTLSNPAGAILALSSAAFTIRDNEGEPQIGFSGSTFSMAENKAQMPVTLTLSGVSQSAVTVRYVTYDLTAKAGKDYTAAAGTAIIPAGATKTAIQVPLLDDAIYEGDETFGIALSLPTGATLGISSATAQITENDKAPLLGLTPAAVSVKEDAGKATLTVTLDSVSSSDTTVQYQTADQSAKAGLDYTAATGTITIAAGQTSATVDILLSDDTLYENAEDFQVLLLSPNGAVLGSAPNAAITLLDNDTLPSAGFDTLIYNADEAGLKAVLTVALSTVSGADTTLSYATADGTAVAGEDYAASTGTVTIPAGSLSAAFEISIINDDLYEEGDVFLVTLSAPAGAVLNQDTAQVMITESKPVPGLSILPVTVRESVGEASVTVSLSHLSNQPITVAYATGDKTAKASSDYRPSSGTLTIPALTSSGTIKIRIYNDDVYEGTETLKVILSSSAGAVITTDTSLVTITDNDKKPNPTPMPAEGPSPTPTPTAPPAATATPAVPTLTPTLAVTPSMAPVVTVHPGVVYVDVQEEVVATQVTLETDSGAKETATVVNVDQALFERTVAYAKNVSQDTGAQVILRFPDITPQEQDAAMRLQLNSSQVLSAAREGMGVSVKMENVTFVVPDSVLTQAAQGTQSVSLECRKAQDDKQPSFRIELGDGSFLGQAFQYALAVTRDGGDTGYVDQFDSPVTITVQLTPEEAAAITDLSKIGMRYTNPVTGKTELLPSVYDPVTMTLTFSTTYFAEAAETLAEDD